MKILLVILIILLSTSLGYLLSREEVQKVRDKHNEIEKQRLIEAYRAKEGCVGIFMPGVVDFGKEEGK